MCQVRAWHRRKAAHGREQPLRSGSRRAFRVDTRNEDTDELVHAYLGVFHPTGGGPARTVDGSGIHSFGDAERFTSRFSGVITRY